MRRTRFTIVTLSMAASAMVLGMPAATAASMSEAGSGQVQVVGRHHGDRDFHHRHHRHHRHHNRHHRVVVRRRHVIRWHHRCGPGWDSGWVRGSDRTRISERDRDDFLGNGGRRDRDFRDSGDRGWGRGWISTCSWRREGGYHGTSARKVIRVTQAPVTKVTHPTGAVRAGEGGSVATVNTSELAAGGSLVALGVAGAVGALRRRSSSR